jgi:hypothetical protein
MGKSYDGRRNEGERNHKFYSKFDFKDKSYFERKFKGFKNSERHL